MFRSCVHGCEPALGYECGDIIGIDAEYLRNSKIEQFGFSVALHKHVSWLYIPMNNLVLMRERYGRTDLEKQLEPTSQIDVFALNEASNRQPFNKFHYKVWQAVCCSARV